MITLMNTTILTADGSFEMKTISLDQAKAMVSGAHFESAIGHESTAQILSELLSVVVAANRVNYSQEVGDVALCFKLKGRPPEGVVLNAEEIEKIGYEFKLLTRTA
jgi:Domain of unknown function (DUF1874)